MDRLLVFAQEDTASGGGLTTFILFIVLMAGVFYLFIIRPQRTRMRRQQALVGSIDIGDRVRTVGGILGVVISMNDDEITLEVESGTLRMVKWAVAAKTDEGA